MKVPTSKRRAFVSMSGTPFGMVTLLSTLLLSAPVILAEAAGKAVDTASASSADEYHALVKEYDAARQGFSKAYGAAKTDEERQKLIENYPQPRSWSRRLLDLARKNPKDPVAADALAWVVTNDRYGEVMNEALEILLRDHIESEKLGAVAQALAYSDAKQAETALQTMLQKNPHHEVQGQALFALGLIDKSRRKDSDAEKRFEQVLEKFADIQGFRGTLADAARGQLYEMRNLAIGKVAPDIEGQDLDAKSFKLSDYRGKIVVIDFWGDW